MQLTIMTFNIRIGTWNPLGLEGVARVIERHNPDVVGLQEVHRFGHASGPVDQTAWLSQRLGMQGVFGASRDTNDMWKAVAGEEGKFGNAVLSRLPVRDRAIHPLPQPIQTDEPRSVLGAALESPAGPLNVFVTHWSLDFEQRQVQAESTVEFTEMWHAGAPVVLMGDFNALPDSPEIAKVRAAWKDAWEEAGVPVESRASFPSGPQGSVTPDRWSAALDYIFVSKHVRVEHIGVIYDDTQASDHNPVVARLRLGERETGSEMT